MKKILCVTVACSIIFGSSAMASENSGAGAPIIGEFQSDDALIAEENAKSDMAQKYYQAKMNGDYGLAASYLNQNAKGMNSVAALSTARATSKTLNMPHYPQETDYYCGYAAIQSILAEAGIYQSQTQIAEGSHNTYSSLPWYYSDYSSLSQYPARVYLKNNTGYNYVPFPLAVAGSTSISKADMEYKVVFTIDQGYGVLVAGESRGGETSCLPGYPSHTVNHWIAINGYSSSGASIKVVDPAKSSAVWWSEGISSNYSVSSTTMSAYASARGIIW